jgi:hypothetical protein
LDNLAFVVLDDRSHVILNNSRQGVAVVDLGHPRRQLTMPEESVTTHELSVLLGEADDLISVGEVELSS